MSDINLDDVIEQAKRAFALGKYEESVELYATALETATAKFGEDSLTSADLYFSYGRALLENAITQSGVLGKKEEDNKEEEAAPSGDNPFISFSGDIDDAAGDEGQDGDDDEEPVELLNGAAMSDAPEPGESEHEPDEEGDAEGDVEPEDDFNAAWEVLDLARAIYLKSQDEDEKIKIKLADTYIALGDVSLETEKFDQAIEDYTEGVKLKEDLLPLSSRQIAEGHYKLSMVLDLTGGQLSTAIEHAERALASVDARIDELKNPSGVSKSTKGKGKSRSEEIAKLTKSDLELELKELTELREDVALKVEELKTLPDDSAAASAPELAAKALDQELRGAAPTAEQAKFINDLTTMVRKKAKKEPTAEAGSSGGKRKADEDDARETTPPEKKIKL